MYCVDEFTPCFRPPPNLLRQEIEGTQIYLTVLNKTANGSGDEVRAIGTSEQPLYDPDNAEFTSKAAEQKLREEAERQLVSFCGHILKEVSTLQPAPSEAVQADYHRALDLRSPVTVQVVGYTLMSFSVFRAPSLSSCQFQNVLRN